MITRRAFLNWCKNAAITAGGLYLFGSLEAFASSGTENRRVVLDPGHGMGNRKKGLYDPGCVYDGIQEADVVLDQTKRIERILSGKGIDVRYTRIDNVTETPLSSRALFANKANSDLYVSLHCNASENASAHGIRIYHFPKSKNGIVLGRVIQDNLEEGLRELGITQDYEGLREGRFRVLKHTKMPAVLVESGFLSNKRDREYLTKNPEEIAKGIANGILEYFA